jgi:hypothetical protein
VAIRRRSERFKMADSMLTRRDARPSATLDTSGAGALIIDAAVARAWTGFHIPVTSAGDDVDLETGDGVGWRIDDTFDFDHPVTDYDRLCLRHLQARAPVLINDLHEQAFASISDGSESFAWWPELAVFSGNAVSEPTADAIARAAFVRIGVIDVPSGLLWLMNPCSHGAAVRAGDDGWTIEVNAGAYVVEARPRGESEDNVLLVRLRMARH